MTNASSHEDVCTFAGKTTSLVSCFLEKRPHEVTEGREFAPEQNARTDNEEWQLIPEAHSHLSLLLSQIHKRDAHLMHFLAKSPFSL